MKLRSFFYRTGFPRESMIGPFTATGRMTTQPVQRVLRSQHSVSAAAVGKPVKVLFCGNEFAASAQALSENLSHRRDILVESCKLSELKQRISEATIAVPLMGKLDADTISRGVEDAGQLEFIMQWGVGLEGVDIDAATQHGVLVANCQMPQLPKDLVASAPSPQSISTVEIALYLLLSTFRQAPLMHKGTWGGPRGETLNGKHILVVGYGGIGAPIVETIQKMGARTSILRSRPWDAKSVSGVGDAEKLFDMSNTASPAEALRTAVAKCLEDDCGLDAVVLACPLNKSTIGMFNSNTLDSLRMGNRSIHLVNVGRGGLADRTAVESGLETGLLKGFASDVWWSEPPHPDDPLLPRIAQQDPHKDNGFNITLTPHVGGCTHEGAALMDLGVLENVQRYLDGFAPIKNCKNFDDVLQFRKTSLRPYRGTLSRGRTIGKPFGSSNAMSFSTLSSSCTRQTGRGLQATGSHATNLFTNVRKLSTSSSPSIKAPVMTRRCDPQKLLESLQAKFDLSQISTSGPILEAHGKDESYHEPVMPDVVFFPRCTEDVQEAVRICSDLDCPIVNFGQGTSLEGMVAALAGGLCIDYRDMNKVLKVNPEDMDCVVQPGCTRLELNHALKEYGLFFPIDPGADASIGGMVSTRASGTNAVRYGTMKQNVLGLSAVTAKSQVIHTGSRARKSSAGYDLTSLLVGSEGTLACLTEITLKLHGLPESIAAAVCSFEPSAVGLKSAVDTVVTSLQLGVPIARAELLDARTMQAVNQYSKLGLSESPTLFLEFHGTEAGVKEQGDIVQQVAKDFGGHEFQYAHHEEDRNELWKARHMAYYASMALRPGCKGWPTDVCVPISNLADCISGTSEDVERLGLQAPIFGHVGDGNFHCILLLHPDDGEQELTKLLELNDSIVDRALKNDGTCTGEHGVGYGKTKWLVREHGQAAVDTMSSIKLAFDPQNIFNPGKIVPSQ